MILSKKGIETKEWVPPAFEGAEGYYESTFHTPTRAPEFFKFWHDQLDRIDDDYTLGDLIGLLRPLDEVTVLILSSMCRLDLKLFLEEAAKPSVVERSSDIDFLEVSNRCELSTYEKDPNRPDTSIDWLSDEEAEAEEEKDKAIADITGDKPPMAIFDGTGDDPITGKPKSTRLRLGEMYGKWVGPYYLMRDFHGWGHWDEPYPGAIELEGFDPNFKGGISLSFTPVNELLTYSLRYNDRFEMCDDLYKGNVLVSDGINITFGEFVHAVLWEIGFYGDPESRDEAGDEILERSKRAHEQWDKEE
jgi:hypothetical protein